MKSMKYFFMFFLFVFTLGGCDHELPVIKLNGQDHITIQLGDTFDDPGAYIDNDDFFNDLDITIESNLDTTHPGTYQITYSVLYEGITYSITREVVIENIEPEDVTYFSLTSYNVTSHSIEVSVEASLSDLDDVEATLIVYLDTLEVTSRTLSNGNNTYLFDDLYEDTSYRFEIEYSYLENDTYQTKTVDLGILTTDDFIESELFSYTLNNSNYINGLYEVDLTIDLDMEQITSYSIILRLVKADNSYIEKPITNLDGITSFSEVDTNTIYTLELLYHLEVDNEIFDDHVVIEELSTYPPYIVTAEITNIESYIHEVVLQIDTPSSAPIQTISYDIELYKNQQLDHSYTVDYINLLTIDQLDSSTTYELIINANYTLTTSSGSYNLKIIETSFTTLDAPSIQPQLDLFTIEPTANSITIHTEIKDLNYVMDNNNSYITIDGIDDQRMLIANQSQTTVYENLQPNTSYTISILISYTDADGNYINQENISSKTISTPPILEVTNIETNHVFYDNIANEIIVYLNNPSNATVENLTFGNQLISDILMSDDYQSLTFTLDDLSEGNYDSMLTTLIFIYGLGNEATIDINKNFSFVIYHHYESVPDTAAIRFINMYILEDQIDNYLYVALDNPYGLIIEEIILNDITYDQNAITIISPDLCYIELLSLNALELLEIKSITYQKNDESLNYTPVVNQKIYSEQAITGITYIDSVADFNNIDLNLSGIYVLTSDIDFNGEQTTLFAREAPFTGTIYGMGHTISNITLDIETHNYPEIPNYLYNVGAVMSNLDHAYIKDINFDHITFNYDVLDVPTIHPNIGLLFGKINHSYLENIQITNSIFTSTNFRIPEGNYGAISGLVTDSIIKNVKVESNIDITYCLTSCPQGLIRVGGAFGMIDQTQISMIEISSDISVLSLYQTVAHVGGVIGFMNNASNASHLIHQGDITVDSGYVGGIVGSLNHVDSIMKYLISVGSIVNRDGYTGGIAGYASATIDSVLSATNINVLDEGWPPGYILGTTSYDILTNAYVLDSVTVVQNSNSITPMDQMLPSITYVSEELSTKDFYTNELGLFETLYNFDQLDYQLNEYPILK